MARKDARFTIRKPFGPPQSHGYSLSAITAREWGSIASNVNCVRVDVDTAATETETHAVFPSWEYGNDDTRLENWHVRACPDEEEAIELVEAGLMAELAPLLQKPKPTDAEAQRIYELQRDLANLGNYRYWQEVYNAFGDGAVALYRSCSAPNVPYKLRSNTALQPDKPITIWLHRAQPHEGQQNCWVRFRFGHWALTIRQENEIKLTRYRDGVWYEEDEEHAGQYKRHSANGTDFDAIEAAEAAIETIRDNGRMTADEKLQVANWQQAIRNIRAVLSKQGKTLLPAAKEAYKAQVSAYKQAIAALKATKTGLTSGQEAAIRAAQKDLVAEEYEVKFQQTAQSTFNRDLAITIIPQRRGYIILHDSVGKDYCVIEDKLVTENEDDQTVIDSTPLQIDGNGGALWFKVSTIKPVRHAALNSGTVRVEGVNGAASLTVDGTNMPGATVTGVVTPAGSGGAEAYTWSATFATDGLGYLPFLYRLYFDVEATPRNLALETEVASSATLAGLAWDVGSDRDEDNRGRSATWSFRLTREQRAQWEWLLKLANYQIEFHETEQWFTGILGDPEVTEIAGGSLDVQYRCYDRWALLKTDRVWSDCIGDGKRLGFHVRQIAKGLGLADSEIIIEGFDSAGNVVGSGYWTQRTLPTAAPGGHPVMRPEWGQKRADYLKRVVDDFGYDLDLWFDGRGRLRLSSRQTTTKPVQYVRSHAAPTSQRVMRGVKRKQDWSDTCNDLTVQGAVRNGKPLSARYSDYASVYNPAAANYMGRWVTGETIENKALRRQEDVNIALRNNVRLKFMPLETLTFTTDYDETVSVGDRVRCDDETVELRGVRADDREGGEMELTVRVVR